MKEQTEKKKKLTFEKWHLIVILLMLYDAIVSNGSYFVALWLRFDCKYTAIPREMLKAVAFFSPIYAAICIVIFWFLRLYKSVWKYASYSELMRLLIANIFTAILHTAIISVAFHTMPIFYYVVGFGLQIILTAAVRFSYRLLFLEDRKRRKELSSLPQGRVMLIGGGSAGQMILRDITHAAELNDRVMCIIDDDKNKQGRFIDGVPIVGGRDDILVSVEKYKIDKIYLAIPTLDEENRREILNICSETNCELKSLPAMFQLVNGDVHIGEMKNVELEDLLGRASIKVNMDEIYSFISGKVILVTGGGGSIGSELCRKIADHNPKKLIVFDIYENNAHAIQLELRDNHPDLDLEVLIGSVRDSRRINQVFETYHPDVVYHAAAHKHVPLMEDSPCESIKNNAIGTYKTAYAAMTHGCKRFVLISTDKAVNPTNIMGASKRLCEMVIQSFDRKIKDGKASELPFLRCHTEDEHGSMTYKLKEGEQPKTEFVAVRFGNVLGSNGSVIPRFKEQIAKGGPVTVTHPDIIRYFMTIPEAASLVLQAGTYAHGGEIFVLDMGSPVKIDTLARNLIKLSGLRPDVDIKIEYTGLRPGEKLYEEKLMSEEGLRTTPNHLIHIGSPIPFDVDPFLKNLTELMNVAYDGDEQKTRDLVMQTVPTYHPAGRHGAGVKDATYKEQIKAVEQNEQNENKEPATV